MFSMFHSTAVFEKSCASCIVLLSEWLSQYLFFFKEVLQRLTPSVEPCDSPSLCTFLARCLEVGTLYLQTLVPDSPLICRSWCGNHFAQLLVSITPLRLRAKPTVISERLKGSGAWEVEMHVCL